MRSAPLLFCLIFLDACGQSDLYAKLDEANRKQQAINNVELGLWKRSPTLDGGSYTISAADSAQFDSIPRTTLQFHDIVDLKQPIRATDLIVVSDTQKKLAPIFFDWAGRDVPWADPGFQVFEAYYHVKEAMLFAAQKLPALNTEQIYSATTPLRVVAAEEGSIFDTAYDPSTTTIKFFRNQDGAAKNFIASDEADIVYHEFCHTLQHAAAKSVMEDTTNTNFHLDAFLEGLSDFCSTAIMRDDNSFNYFAANAKGIFTPSVRYFTDSYIRKVKNDLFFPDAYLGGYRALSDRGVDGAYHMVGRVVSGALNDLVKYLAGDKVTLLSHCQPGACEVTLSNAVERSDAYDYVLELAYSTFANATLQMTMNQYFKDLIAGCPTNRGWCTSEVQAAFQKIIVGRGLVSTYSDYNFPESSISVGMDDGSGATLTNPLVVSTTTGFLEFPQDRFASDSGFSYENNKVESCEALVIFPNLKNNSAATGSPFSMIETWVELISVEGFTPVRNADGGNSAVEILVQPDRDPTVKIFGWMEPGELALDLVRNRKSRWYTPQNGSPFAKFLGPGAGEFPTPVGWMVRAPSGANAVGKATFALHFNVYNTNSYAGTPYYTDPITTTIHTNTQNTGMFQCN